MHGFWHRSGSIDLRAGVATQLARSVKFDDTSPPVIYKNVVIVGSELQEYPSIGPSGAVRAFDVHTGKLVWRFDTVPKLGEIGHDTWQDDDWKNRSGTNAWGPLSVDVTRGLAGLSASRVHPPMTFMVLTGKVKIFSAILLWRLTQRQANLSGITRLYITILVGLRPERPSRFLLSVRRADGREIPAVAEVIQDGICVCV